MKSCGGCIHFQKIRNYETNTGAPSGGICQGYDGRCGSDYGRKCKLFEPPKYDRKHLNIKSRSVR